jgi:hypothetical protein
MAWITGDGEASPEELSIVLVADERFGREARPAWIRLLLL